MIRICAQSHDRALISTRAPAANLSPLLISKQCCHYCTHFYLLLCSITTEYTSIVCRNPNSPNMDAHRRRVPLEKRKRTETSCDKCKSRKQKCDRGSNQSRCRYCELHGIACSITQPRKRRLYGSADSLAARLILLETLVKGLVPEADLSTNDEMLRLGKSLGIPLPAVDESNGEMTIAKAKVDEYTLPLLPDQQGQVQYIGPASSFSFHLHLRRLIGNSPDCEFAMFGRNAADQDESPDTSILPRAVDDRDQRAVSNMSSDCNSPSDAVKEIDAAILDGLIDAYFDTIHPDFPVLHEASFREAHEAWSVSTSPTDPAWVCGLICVLLLSRRVAPVTLAEETEKKWWRHVQTLLPSVLFASNLCAVQALMLAALHLHNTSHRDACWNLTGTAVRIAFAIGLHRDDVKHFQTPLGRELRKQLWWTLSAFEYIQVSSYDRPSAIANTLTSVSCPNERIVGVPGHCPQGFTQWSQRLVILLGSACKALNPLGSGSTIDDDAYSAPLSPSAGVLRDLDKWKEALPAHLRLEVTNSLAPSSQRPIYLLHAQYHYIAVLMSRSALMRRATILSNNSIDVLHSKLPTLSDICVNAGKSLGQLLRRLDTINKYNATTWWDVFYTVASALVLVLDIICCVKRQELELAVESQNILRDLASISARQLQNPRVPGSMHKMCSIIMEVSSMADQFVSTSQSNSNNDSAQTFQTNTKNRERSPTNFFYAAPLYAPENGSNDAESSDYSNLSRDTGAQYWGNLSSIDGNGQLQEWCWDDIEAILKGNAAT